MGCCNSGPQSGSTVAVAPAAILAAPAEAKLGDNDSVARQPDERQGTALSNDPAKTVHGQNSGKPPVSGDRSHRADAAASTAREAAASSSHLFVQSPSDSRRSAEIVRVSTDSPSPKDAASHRDRVRTTNLSGVAAETVQVKDRRIAPAPPRVPLVMKTLGIPGESSADDASSPLQAGAEPEQVLNAERAPEHAAVARSLVLASPQMQPMKDAWQMLAALTPVARSPQRSRAHSDADHALPAVSTGGRLPLQINTGGQGTRSASPSPHSGRGGSTSASATRRRLTPLGRNAPPPQPSPTGAAGSSLFVPDLAAEAAAAAAAAGGGAGAGSAGRPPSAGGLARSPTPPRSPRTQAALSTGPVPLGPPPLLALAAGAGAGPSAGASATTVTTRNSSASKPSSRVPDDATNAISAAALALTRPSAGSGVAAGGPAAGSSIFSLLSDRSISSSSAFPGGGGGGSSFTSNSSSNSAGGGALSGAGSSASASGAGESGLSPGRGAASASRPRAMSHNAGSSLSPRSALGLGGGSLGLGLSTIGGGGSSLNTGSGYLFGQDAPQQHPRSFARRLSFDEVASNVEQDQRDSIPNVSTPEPDSDD